MLSNKIFELISFRHNNNDGQKTEEFFIYERSIGGKQKELILMKVPQLNIISKGPGNSPLLLLKL